MNDNKIEIEALYERYAPMVWRRCRALLRSDEEAKDAMQDVFVNVLKRQEKLQDQGLSSFLYTVATNHCLNRIRDAKKRGIAADIEVLDAIAELPDTESALGARLLLGKLFADEKATSLTIATLYYLDGMTYDEVAQTVGMSISGVRKRLRGLKSKLAQFEVAS